MKKVLVLCAINGYTRDALRGVMAFSRQHGPWSLCLSHRRSLRECLQLGDCDCDGIIAYPERDEDPREILGPDFPVVSMTSSAPPGRTPLVISDHLAIGRLAAQHLLQPGVTHFAFLGVQDHWGCTLRSRGFAETIEQSGRVACRYHGELLLDYSHGDEHCRSCIAQWLQTLPKPIGIMVFSDEMAQTLTVVASRMNLRVPEDVAVIGVNNDDLLCDLNQPPLSSVDLASDRIGFEAAALLAQLMRGEDPPAGPIAVPPRGIVPRQSSEILAIEDPEVVQALQYIRLHAAEGIHIEDVRAHLKGMPRRTLERRFREAVGHSLYAEIQNRRLDRARQLLAETQMSVLQIALTCRFKHPSNFTIAFQRRFDMTPLAYRKSVARR